MVLLRSACVTLVRQGARSLALSLAFVVLAGVGGGHAATLVTDITFTARSDGQGYVVRVQSEGPIEAYGMPQTTGEHALKWVLYHAELHQDYQKRGAEGPVRRYSVTQQDEHLVLRLQLDPDRQINPTAYRDGASDDLLLNLAYAGGGPPVADAQESSGTSASSEEVTSQPASDGSGASKAARERWRLDTVVIDPGHGGKDPGAVANGLYEKNIVMDVATKLGEYIENRLDINVVYTRRDDRFIPLEERGHMANEAGAKLFLSLHVNAARAASAHGTETYFLGPSKTEAAEKVMERENSVIKYEENTEKYEDYDEQALVRQTLTQSAYMRQSERLASIIQTQFEERVSRRNRGVHQAGFYVLWSASMPSVLVELGFLTNDREARFLNSDQGQTYLASAIFRAVRSYKKKYEKGIVATDAGP